LLIGVLQVARFVKEAPLKLAKEAKSKSEGHKAQPLGSGRPKGAGWRKVLAGISSLEFSSKVESGKKGGKKGRTHKGSGNRIEKRPGG